MKDRSDDPSHHERRLEAVLEPIVVRFKRKIARLLLNELSDEHFTICLIKREREMFYLTTALNTFYLRLYGVRHMVKYHSDSEKGNPLPPHRLLLSINSKGSFICTIPQTG